MSNSYIEVEGIFVFKKLKKNYWITCLRLIKHYAYKSTRKFYIEVKHSRNFHLCFTPITPMKEKK